MMRKGRRNEFDLPVEIIQHIQTFLSPKESTQSTLLSKPWFTAWLTPPVLRLYQQDFPVSEEFWNFSRKSLQRYKDSNRKIVKLFLDIDLSLPANAIPAIPVVDEFIRYALSLGLTVFHLKTHPTQNYVLPVELFQRNSLTELHASFAVINHRQPVHCSRLTSLELIFVRDANHIVGDILQGCPFMENLVLRLSGRLPTIVDVSNLRKLVNLCVSGKEVRVLFKNLDTRTTNVYEYRYLLQLRLSEVELENDFFRDFSSTFPCIKNLGLAQLAGVATIQISSHSLRLLSLSADVLDKVRLDVPNLFSFDFVGNCNRTPSLSFATAVASRNFGCSVMLAFMDGILENSWFLELRNFLTELSLSKISLNIAFLDECTFSAEMTPYFPIPEVEDLHLDVCEPPSWNMSSGLLCRLFWTCRPSFIHVEEPTRQLLYEQLILNDNNDLFCLYNLEKVYVELFEDNRKWQTIPSEKLINAPEIPHEGKRIRFRLSWGPVE